MPLIPTPATRKVLSNGPQRGGENVTRMFTLEAVLDMY